MRQLSKTCVYDAHNTLDPKDAINRRLYKGLIIVKTAIYRVSCPNRTILVQIPQESEYPTVCPFSIEQILDEDFYGL